MSRASGVTEQQLRELDDYETSAAFTGLERLVLRLADAMSRTPADVGSDLREELLAHLTRGQLAELAAAIAWENHRARLNRALGVRAVGFSDGAFCVLPHQPGA